VTEPGVGHNSRGKVAKDQLKAFVERIERLEEEKDGTVSDIGDVYKEAKGNGFDVKALRAAIALRKKERDSKAQLQEHKAILDTYLDALGMDYLL